MPQLPDPQRPATTKAVIIIYAENRFATLTPLAYTELLLRLGDVARKKVDPHDPQTRIDPQRKVAFGESLGYPPLMSDSSSLGPLATGVAEIDVEHAVQVAMVKAFRLAVESRLPTDALSELLSRIDDYTSAHFLAEQLLMRVKAYPGYEAHVAQHDRLLSELRELKRALEEGAWVATLEGAEKLQRWLTNHIATADQAFAAHLQTLSEP